MACTMRLKLPPQDLEKPTHFPYNTAFRPRRIDYVAIRGRTAEGHHIGDHRNIPCSDHEAVIIVLQGDQPSTAPTKAGPGMGAPTTAIPAGAGGPGSEYPTATRGHPPGAFKKQPRRSPRRGHRRGTSRAPI